jgi:hypothetical protein
MIPFSDMHAESEQSDSDHSRIETTVALLLLKKLNAKLLSLALLYTTVAALLFTEKKMLNCLPIDHGSAIEGGTRQRMCPLAFSASLPGAAPARNRIDRPSPSLTLPQQSGVMI